MILWVIFVFQGTEAHSALASQGAEHQLYLKETYEDLLANAIINKVVGDAVVMNTITAGDLPEEDGAVIDGYQSSASSSAAPPPPSASGRRMHSTQAHEQ